jgi:hypothetical protein
MPLSKTLFKSYLQCPEYFWYKIHMPEVLAEQGLNDFEQMLADQGQLVEKQFYKLFPETVMIDAKGYSSVEETKAIAATGISHIAQAGFSTADFFAQSDLVIFKNDKHIEVFEIKSSSSMQNVAMEDSTQAPSKQAHIEDLAFQYQVFTQAGYIIDNMYLVELNKKYSKSTEMDLNTLFIIRNVTEDVLLIASYVQVLMQAALVTASIPLQPSSCECRYLPRKKQCPAFSFMYPDLTTYNVYDLAIARSPKRLKEFIDASIFRIEDIPAGTKMTDSYRDQVITWNENREIILADEIDRLLIGLTYPLYFLDYETNAPAIPLFAGTRPYQQIPFQYSLHIIDNKEGEIRHVEYLHDEFIDPMRAVVNQLRNDIGDTGTIIVWNKTFEKKCNETLAECIPDMSGFLLAINHRLFDLMEIFSKHLYVHKDFQGSYSIKKVLPVLVPELSYTELTIRDGGTATSEWVRMVFELEEGEEKEQIRKDLLAYCKLDTLAMVEIFNVLNRKIGS